MRDKSRVFVSYATADRHFADRLVDGLGATEPPVFVHRVDVKNGDHILSALRSQIAAADFLVLLLSPDALESPWVKFELEYAVSKELRQRLITVVPFKVKPCKVPEYLAAWTVIDATRNFEKASQQLGNLLRSAPLVRLEKLEPQQFEALVGDLLRAYGFREVEPAVRGADQGFDFYAQSVDRDPFGRPETVEWIIEVKAARHKADTSSLRTFLGALSIRKERGLFVTSGQITTPAREWLEHVAKSGGPRLSLIEGTEITRLLLAKPRLVSKYFGRAAGT